MPKPVTRAMLPALAFCAIAALSITGASAAPLATRDLAPAAGSLVEKIDLVTKCWVTPRGFRRCRTFYVNPARLTNPNQFPTGSRAWWRAMDREGRGGFRTP